MYLIDALTSALKSYPAKAWPGCCKDACNVCKLFATPYKPREVQWWWSIFKIKNCFPHPRGEEDNAKKDVLPPSLHNNKVLHQKEIKHCTTILCDLTIDMAKEYITHTLIPMAYPLTSEHLKGAAALTIPAEWYTIKINGLGVAKAIWFFLWSQEK